MKGVVRVAGGTKRERERKKKDFAESGTGTPTLPSSGMHSVLNPVLVSKLKGLIAGYICTRSCAGVETSALFYPTICDRVSGSTFDG